MNPRTNVVGKRKPNAYQWGMYMTSRKWRRYGVEDMRDHDGWWVVDRGEGKPGAVRHVVRVEVRPTRREADARARELNGLGGKP